MKCKISNQRVPISLSYFYHSRFNVISFYFSPQPGLHNGKEPSDQTLNEFFLSSVAPPFFNEIYTMVLGGYASPEEYYVEKCRQKLRRSAYVEVAMATDDVTNVVVEPMYTAFSRMAHLGIRR